jgi:hypothetical protein
MRRVIFSISALSLALLFAPVAEAQHNINDSNDFAFENLCVPEYSEPDFYERRIVSGLDFDQLEMVRIQLLERGYDPGFHPDRDNTIDWQLTEALALFQLMNDLRVTGYTDIPTLVALSFPIQQLHPQLQDEIS